MNEIGKADIRQAKFLFERKAYIAAYILTYSVIKQQTFDSSGLSAVVP